MRCDNCGQPVKVARYPDDTADETLDGSYMHDDGDYAAWYCKPGWDTWAMVDGRDEPEVVS